MEGFVAIGIVFLILAAIFFVIAFVKQGTPEGEVFGFLSALFGILGSIFK